MYWGTCMTFLYQIILISILLPWLGAAPARVRSVHRRKPHRNLTAYIGPALRVDQIRDLRKFAAFNISQSYPRKPHRNHRAHNSPALQVDQNRDLRKFAAFNISQSYPRKPHRNQRAHNSPALQVDQNRDLRKFAAFNISQSYPRQPSLVYKDQVTYNRKRGKFLLGDQRNKGQLKVKYGPKPHPGTPWPMPKDTDMYKIAYVVGTSLQFTYDTSLKNADILDWYSTRIGDVIRNVRENKEFGDVEEEVVNDRVIIGDVAIKIERDSDLYPRLSSDESYILSVNSSGCTIGAVEVWGALRGLETLSQLVHTDSQGRLLIHKSTIRDGPRFRHRGLMIDTSRHFISLDTIIQNLEAMAMNKLNVFHWHIVDDQSFPYQSKVYPDLSDKGAFHPEAVYTHDDIRHVIKEARLRGIRVIPEFDSPGHTLSWGYGQQNLLTTCFHRNQLVPNGEFGPINPLLESTYKFLEKLLTEVMGLFVDEFVHLGGDEVPLDCWTFNPELRMKMKTMNLTSLMDLPKVLQIYETRLLRIVKDIGGKLQVGGKAIVWQEVVDGGTKVDPDSLVQLWKVPPGGIHEYISQGHNVIYSGCWYVDKWTVGVDWDEYYLCEKGLNAHRSSHKGDGSLFGGEVCMWNEYADDPEMTSRIWPRAAAAAERLWSQASVTDVQRAAPRLEQQRCRMMRRKIPVGVASGPGYCGEHKRSAHKQIDGASIRTGEAQHNLQNAADLGTQHNLQNAADLGTQHNLQNAADLVTQHNLQNAADLGTGVTEKNIAEMLIPTSHQWLLLSLVIVIVICGIIHYHSAKSGSSESAQSQWAILRGKLKPLPFIYVTIIYVIGSWALLGFLFLKGHHT